MARTHAPLELGLNSAEQRALASFLAGRLSAGRLHEELLRAALPPAPPATLPDDTAAIPVPAPRPTVLHAA